MGDVQRQQRLVLFDEVRAATEVHVHVPQARNQIAPLAVDLLAGTPRLAHCTVAAHRHDILAAHHDGLVRHGGGMRHIDHGRMPDHQIGMLGREGGRGQCKQHRKGKTQGHGRCTGREEPGHLTAGPGPFTS